MKKLMFAVLFLTGCDFYRPSIYEDRKYNLGQRLVIVNDFYEGCSGIATEVESNILISSSPDLVFSHKYTLLNVECPQIKSKKIIINDLQVIQSKLKLIKEAK
jgi:hypothetical protein